MMEKVKVETFRWIVETVMWCLPNDTKINSSPFLVKDLKNTKWYLQLHFKGDEVSFNLFRCHEDKGPERISIMYHLSFLSTDGCSYSMKCNHVKSFGLSDCSGFPSFISRKVLFGNGKSLYLPNDVLTATCQIWEPHGQVVKATESCDRTRIGLERMCFFGLVNEFSKLEPDARKEICIHTSSAEGNFIRSVSLFLNYGVKGSTDIIIKMILSERNHAGMSCKISLFSRKGETIEFAHAAIPTSQLAFGEAFFLPLLFSKQDVISKKSTHLHRDVLTLNFEFLRTDGEIVYQAIEAANVGCKSFRVAQCEEDNVVNVSESSSCSLKEDLWTFFENGHMCDKILETSTRTFAVHSHILSARSPVFCAMFSLDMKEKREDTIPIPDIDGDILFELLRFIYKDTVENMQFETAVQLFSAADKYEIITLRKICADYLKNHLTTKNACDVLVIADVYQDEEMIADVVKFIKRHIEILHSSEWNELEKANCPLTYKTFRKIFLK